MNGPSADLSAPALELRAVSKRYGSAIALRDISLRTESGRVVAVLGPNGAGKSTLLRVAAGITRPSAGEVRVAGRPLHGAGARRRIGFAGHLTFLYGHLSAEENLRFYAQLYDLPAERVEAGLSQFGLLAYRRRPVRSLSRGLVQRLSLARTLLHDPEIVLLDEPFTGLDADAARTLRAVIDRLRAEGRTLVMATHAWNDARDLADEAVVLVGGRLALRETAQALDPERLVTLYQTA